MHFGEKFREILDYCKYYNVLFSELDNEILETFRETMDFEKYYDNADTYFNDHPLIAQHVKEFLIKNRIKTKNLIQFDKGLASLDEKDILYLNIIFLKAINDNCLLYKKSTKSCKKPEEIILNKINYELLKYQKKIPFDVKCANAGTSINLFGNVFNEKSLTFDYIDNDKKINTYPKH